MDKTIEEQNAIMDKAVASTQALKQATQENYDQSRSWSTGWKQAFNDYVDNATNAAQTAKNVFQKATQGMEDAIVNFAKTGKFEWKGFLASIVEELLRSQVKQLIANVFGGLSLGGSTSTGSNSSSGLLGLGGLFGFLAEGGPASANRPYIVGENGPELFIPKTAGTVVPNNQLSSASTSMTNVTYNIQAVDALSFKQLVAKDPNFIYAVSEYGRKSVVGGRR